MEALPLVFFVRCISAASAVYRLPRAEIKPGFSHGTCSSRRKGDFVREDLDGTNVAPTSGPAVATGPACFAGASMAADAERDATNEISLVWCNESRPFGGVMAPWLPGPGGALRYMQPN